MQSCHIITIPYQYLLVGVLDKLVHVFEIEPRILVLEIGTKREHDVVGSEHLGIGVNLLDQHICLVVNIVVIEVRVILHTWQEDTFVYTL